MVEIDPGKLVELALMGGTIAGAAFAVIRKLLEILEKKISPTSAAAPSCPFDPVSSENWHRLREDARASRKVSERLDAELASNGLACVWKDRDEVLDFRNALRDNARELRNLTTFLRSREGL